MVEKKGTFIEHLPWSDALKILNEDSTVVIALGARTKEHGHHLPLNNDWILAEYLVKEMARELPIIVYPTIQYHFFPAFTEYPGSISLSFETSVGLIVDICKSINLHGPKKIYILNTGISTLRPLRKARDILKDRGINLKFSNMIEGRYAGDDIVLEQTYGTHADESETSKMLYIAPQIVQMDRATNNDVEGKSKGGLTRNKDNKNTTYSPCGVYGNATLATVKKGKVLTEHLISYIKNDIENFMA